ncbi:hypothetical protein [Staphylococcus sp. GDY8P143P]|uniref:hypothetical protein n=1 Tax=Mammaliicoccus sciuri TaxID=1296 RepID=UPI00194FD789
MTYYLDKFNKVLFIKFNSKIKQREKDNLLLSFAGSVKEYTIIVLDYDDELVVI